MKENNYENIDPILSKWLEGSIKEDELKTLKKTYSIEHLERIKLMTSQLTVDEFHESKFLGSVNSKIHSESKVKSINPYKRRNILRIAASLLLLIGIGLFVILNTTTKTVLHKTVAGEQKEFRLPDSSKVILIGNSSIEYNVDSWKQKRHIFMHGNAYFEVKHGSDFTTEFENGDVKVLGTKFEVFEDSEYLSVKCFDGTVQTCTKFSNDSIILSKGMAMQYSNAKGLETYELKNQKPDWLTKYSKFKNTPMSAIIIALESKYGVNINSENIDINQSVNAKFVNDDLEKALFMTFAPYSIDFSINEKKVTLQKRNQ